VPNSTGTRVFSLSGNVVRGGNYELPLGTSVRELIYDLGGGIPDGRELKAIIPGGSSVPILLEKDLDTPASFDHIQKAGSLLGSAGLIVMDDTVCMVWLAMNLLHFYRHESCGKCTPCREGTWWVSRVLGRIVSSSA
jgi:NADH-quinone oxidoreductase subunit F